MKKYPKLEVRTSKIHRKGVFAALPIPKGERLIEYTGRRLTSAQTDRSRSDYIFMLTKKIYIDGKNTARYINHSCEPNCEAEIDRGHIWIKSFRDIKKGEELVYNYSYDLEESKDFPCACGTKRCAGFILEEASWAKLKKTQKKAASSAAKNKKNKK